MPLLPGAVVGRYRIASRLGEGGMGEVYRAHDSTLKRDVALKIIAGKVAPDAAALRRFVREAEAASALNHPNIISIFDLGDCEAGPYIVMELVEGRTLRAILDETPTIESLVQIVRQVARALAVAHAAGIVHRDIKPENVMVRDDGYAKVLDFGLALLSDAPVASGSVPTGTLGHVKGTTAYMSPEQARGQFVGSASDVFSMGILLYEMATRRHPFGSAETTTTLLRIVTETPLPPSRVNPEVPAEVDALILDMLEKLPSRRPSAADVDRRLSALAGPRVPSVAAVSAPRHTVGHEALRAALADAFAQAEGGRGQLIVLSGEPGIGKSTLAEDFARDLLLSGRPCHTARGRCSERLGNAGAYLPWLEVLESMRDETGQTAFRTMRSLAPAWYAQVAPLAPEDTTDSLLMAVGQSGSQEFMKRELTTFLGEVSRQRPLVILLDDVQWADASTTDLIGYLGMRLPSMRLLIIATCRTLDPKNAQHPLLPVKLDLQARGVCHEMSLDFLSEADIVSYLALEFPGHAFPPDFARLLHTRTEGNPLFLVGLLRRLRDREAIASVDDAWRLVQSVSDFVREIPESVRSLIDLKIGSLDEADRKLLVAGSVLGSEFEAVVAARALSMDQLEAEDRLDALWRVHQLVQPVREVELGDGSVSARYRFVHVLYQNALYSALGPGRRVAMSAAAAAALLAACGEHAEARAAELALLFEAARDFSRAAEYFLVACERARAVFAEREAVLLARRALDMLRALPDTPDRDALELRFLLTFVVSLSAVESLSAPALEAVYERARVLCERHVDKPELLPILFGRGGFHMIRAELSTSLQIAASARELAERTGDSVAALCVRWGLGSTYSHTGSHLQEAQVLLSEGAAMYRPEIHAGFAAMTNFDPGILLPSQHGRVLWLLGYPDRAIAQADEGLARARTGGGPLVTAFSFFFAAWIRQYRREPEWVMRMANEGAAIAGQHGFAMVGGWLDAMIAWVEARSGQPRSAIERLKGVIERLQRSGALIMRPTFLSLLAEALTLDRRPAEALDALSEAQLTAHRTGERFYLPEIKRQIGELLMGDDATGEGPVDEALDGAVALAREQGSRSLELRASTTRARWWRQRRRGSEASSELARVLAIFTEGFDTPDYLEAQAEIARLGERV